MIAASVGKKQIRKVLLGIVAVVIIVVGAIYFIGKGKDGNGGSVAKIEGATAEQREAYLRSIGIQVDTTSSMAEVAVPKEFDERFTAYNEMLKTTGFDLESLKGEVVKKCTYKVTNRADLGDDILAVLIIHNDEIVAGHLINNTTNDLLPLFDVEAGAKTEDGTPTEETLLPSQEVGKSDDEKKEPAEDGKKPSTEDDVETSGEYPTE